MRIDVNLASRPYEDVRGFYARWGLIMGAAAILSIALWLLALSTWMASRTEARVVAQTQQQIKELEKERKAQEAVLNLPANQSTRDRSQFLNSLIARKAFSWTQVFEDLEKIMPPRVHVLSIHPNITPEDQLELRIAVAAETRDSAVEVVRRMEKSPRFRQPQVRSEMSQQQPQQQAQYTFEIGTLYTPTILKGGL